MVLFFRYGSLVEKQPCRSRWKNTFLPFSRGGKKKENSALNELPENRNVREFHFRERYSIFATIKIDRKYISDIQIFRHFDAFFFLFSAQTRLFSHLRDYVHAKDVHALCVHIFRNKELFIIQFVYAVHETGV